MISMRKRGAVYGVIGLMLCVAVYLNWSYFQSPSELTVAAQSDGDTDESVETSEHVYGEVTSVNADAKTEKTADEEKTSSKRAESTETEGFFADARLKKQAARDEALSLLKDTLSSGDASESAKEEATQKISTIASNSVKETKIENLIVGKGFSDAVVMMEEGSVTASVAGSNGALTETDVAKIADIIVGETGADLTTIRINDANGG
ncbi:MAG: SpoIIIAH-like family protein [Clostridiales bacterium]|nr:SpoIIIAH-like family protein [Clostridiales bacterium]